MNGRSIFRIVVAIVVVVALVGLGAGIYNAGIAQGVVEAGRVPDGAVVPYGAYGYHPFGFGWGFGFGIFGLIFPILFFFLIFGLVRAAFWGGPRRDRHWGRGWYGSGSWADERERQIAELHRRLHDLESSDPNRPSESTDRPTGGQGSSGSGGSPAGAS